MARHKRKGTEWELDLRPVLPTESTTDPQSALAPRIRRSDDPVLDALEQIRLAVERLGQTVDRLNVRLEAVEQRLAASTADSLAARATRQFRDPSAVRDASTVSIERRARRQRTLGPRPISQDDAAGG